LRFSSSINPEETGENVNKKRLREILKMHTSISAYDFGYRFVREDFRFRKKTDFGFVEFGFPIVEYSNSIKLSVVFATRVDQVEDTLENYLSVSDKYRGKIASIITQFNYFFNSDQKIDYSIFDEYEAEKAVGQICNKLMSDIFPFFEKIKSIYDIEKIVNGEIFPPKFNATLYPSSLMTNITLAKLCGNSRIDVLAERYLTEMGINHLARDRAIEFIKFIKSLELPN
jgi:hypothetical protein